MIVDKYGNYVRKFMWQLWGWGRVDICMKFHMRAFFIPFHCISTILKLRAYGLSKKCHPTHTVAT
jgi:hypothetical protein